MKITIAQYAKTLCVLTENKSQSAVDNIIAKFLKLLKKNKQIKLTNKIIEKFSEIYNKKNGIVEAGVISREMLSNSLLNKVSNYVSNKYKAKEVVLNNKIDEKIKGGIVIKVGDEIMDGSVERQLRELKNNLIN